MARIRTIKPSFFSHFNLYQAEIESGLPLRVAYAGLWTMADREGRFKWTPQELKLGCLPYDNLDFSTTLNALLKHEFIVKYEVDGKIYGYIPSWKIHQIINNRESDSILPSPLLGNPENMQYEINYEDTDNGFVYLAYAENSKAIKVGFAENDPERRVRDLSCGSPEQLQLIEAINGKRSLETQIHQALSEYKIHGEWFSLNDKSLRVLNAWFTRASLDMRACKGERKGKEGKGRERDVRGTRLSTDWTMPAEWGNWALGEKPEWDNDRVLLEAAKFKDYWIAKAGAIASKLDWFATWRNWVRNTK